MYPVVIYFSGHLHVFYVAFGYMHFTTIIGALQYELIIRGSQ